MGYISRERDVAEKISRLEKVKILSILIIKNFLPYRTNQKKNSLQSDLPLLDKHQE